MRFLLIAAVLLASCAAATHEAQPIDAGPECPPEVCYTDATTGETMCICTPPGPVP